MIWHYKNGLSRQNKEPVTEYDPFLWFSKSNQFTYNAELVRVPYKTERVNNPIYKKNKAGIKIAWNPNPNGAKRGDIWEYPTLSGKNYENERTDHPTQKPEALILDLIKAFCPLNKDGRLDGFVLDPYMGSGTTAVCCERLNRQGNNIKWLGIELEQKWIDIANKRIDKEKEKLYERDIFI
jgi:DNA modification methylase